MTTSITTRAGKGSPLTHDEVDANFTNLQTTADAALPLAGGTMTGPVTMTGGTVTTSTPLIDATQTWNASGVTFTGWKLNITNTASASGSLLVDWQIGGTSQFSIRKDGFLFGKTDADLFSGNTVTVGDYLRMGGSSGGGIFAMGGAGNCVYLLEFAGQMKAIARSGAYIGWSSSTAAAPTTFRANLDTSFYRNAAGIVEINNGTAGTFRDLKLRNLLAGGGNGSYIQTPSMTVANLASAATAGAGARAFVTDATATTFLSTVAGGGSNKVPVVSDGTNWLIG